MSRGQPGAVRAGQTHRRSVQVSPRDDSGAVEAGAQALGEASGARQLGRLQPGGGGLCVGKPACPGEGAGLAGECTVPWVPCPRPQVAR